MSEDESINSDEIPSDKSSESSNEEENQGEALSNLKKSLNLQNNNSEQDEKNINGKNKNNKIYFFENTSINEGEKNVQTTKKQKIDFSDVFKTFQGDIKNETSRANLSRAVKNFGINEKEKKDGQNKNKEVNKLKENYLEKEEEKIIERETNYINVENEISKYQPKVKEIREADVVDFTQDNKKNVRHIGERTIKEIAKKRKANKKKEEDKDDVNDQIEQVLIENNCVSDQQVLDQEKEELKNINPEELERRYNELRQIRTRLFQKEIENKRKAKIKSKLYHKIKKNKKLKEENDLLEQLGQIDPEAVQNYLNKKRIDRVQERMQLKHSLNSKFQKTIKKYHFDKDHQVKEAIKDNFQLRDKLLQKIEGKENENEFDDNEEGEQNEESEEKSEEGINEEDGKKVLVMNFEDKKEKKKKIKKEENIDNKMGVFSMPFMKNAQENIDIQNKIEKLKNKLNNEDYLDDYDKIEKEDDGDDDENSLDSNNKKNMKKNDSNKIDNKINKKPITITKDAIKKINENTKKINQNNEKTKKLDVKFDTEALQQMIDEENINEDINNFNQFLVENDENKREFLENENKEQLEEIKKNNPEFMPGWGTWAGDDPTIQAKEFLRKKRYEEKIKRLKEQANEGKTNRFVVVSNQIDHNFDDNYLVQELPHDIKNVEQFQNNHNTLIGREVNSLNLYKKLIQPNIVKKIGQIINPMTANDSTKGIQLQEIIEKVTKKKKFTKSKL